MKFAAYSRNDQPDTIQVGIVSDDSRYLSPLAFVEADAAGGVAAVVRAQAAGRPMPAALDPIPMSLVRLRAPFPRPARNVFCVGKNYFDHAREFARSGFDSSAVKPGDDIPSDPIIFTKVPESVIATGEAIRMPVGGQRPSITRPSSR